MSDLATIRPKGNATVPGNAQILPPQAFVDNIAGLVGLDHVTLASKGLTSFSPVGILTPIYVGITNSGPNLNLSGNALDVTSVNAILAWYTQDAGHESPASDGIIDLSGGTNAAPTGQGLTDKQTLIDAGWTVTTR